MKQFDKIEILHLLLDLQEFFNAGARVYPASMRQRGPLNLETFESETFQESVNRLLKKAL